MGLRPETFKTQTQNNLLCKISAKLQQCTVAHLDACQFKGGLANFVQLDVQYVQ